MDESSWSVAEFERLSPAEQDEAFQRAVKLDLDAVDPAFLDRVRQRVLAREAADST